MLLLPEANRQLNRRPEVADPGNRCGSPAKRTSLGGPRRVTCVRARGHEGSHASNPVRAFPVVWGGSASTFGSRAASSGYSTAHCWRCGLRRGGVGVSSGRASSCSTTGEKIGARQATTSSAMGCVGSSTVTSHGKFSPRPARRPSRLNQLPALGTSTSLPSSSARLFASSKRSWVAGWTMTKFTSKVTRSRC